jgi:hypothetical protein
MGKAQAHDEQNRRPGAMFFPENSYSVIYGVRHGYRPQYMDTLLESGTT